MAAIRLHPIFESIHGKAGSIVFIKRNGTQFMRTYVIPYDPKTELQLKNRNTFGHFVASWQKLPQGLKDSWNQYGRKRNMTGYNLFISENMKSYHRGEGLELVNITYLYYKNACSERILESCYKHSLPIKTSLKNNTMFQKNKKTTPPP